MLLTSRDPFPTFGSWLRDQRTARGWTQEVLAGKLALSSTYIGRLERADRPPTAEVITRVAATLGIPRSMIPTGAPHAPQEAVLPLVGRADDVMAVVAHVERARCVVLTGPPGVGKTSMGKAALPILDREYRHGAWSVGLEERGDPDQVGSYIASALRLSDRSQRDPVARLVAHLADKELVLLIDNFEHVIGAAPILSQLLRKLPDLRMLVTSRERLRIEHEEVHPVGPLAFPGLEVARSGHEDLSAWPAVELFLARFRQAVPGYVMRPGDLDAIAEICARVDGLPLEIELAAASCGLGGPAVVARVLRDRRSLPAEGRRDSPERHISSEANIGWSYELLGGEERRLFGALSVFAGGFQLESAVAVGYGSATSVDRALFRLVEHSLVAVQGTGGPSRYSMLQSVHDYARRRLADTGDLERVRSLHAAHFADLAIATGSKLTGPDQANWLGRLDNELANLDVAFAWLVEHRPSVALEAAGSVWRFAYQRSRLDDGLRWLERALAASDTDGGAPAARSQALVGAGVLTRVAGDLARSNALLEEAMACALAWDARPEYALATLNRGIGAVSAADWDQACSMFVRAGALYDGLGDARGSAHAGLLCLGVVDLSMGKIESAADLFRRSVERFRALGDVASVGQAASNRGWALALLREWEAAWASYDESLEAFRQLGDRRGQASTCANLGRLELLRDHLDDAAGHVTEALVLADALGEHPLIAECLHHSGILSAHRAEPIRATLLLACASAMRSELGTPFWADEGELFERALKLARDLLLEDFQATWDEGSRLGVRRAIDLARCPPGDTGPPPDSTQPYPYAQPGMRLN